MSDLSASIATALRERTANGIADAIGQLITEERIAVGDQLPTVRALADELGVSPSTVSDAWRILREHGVIETDRRRGTTIRGTSTDAASRSWHVPVAPGTLALDLSTGTPDPALLPPLGPALQRVHDELTITSYLDDPIVAELSDALHARWPFPAAAVTIVDGAQDALDRLIGATIAFGDTVMVETPTFPPLLDMLELAGARVVGVQLDAEGPNLASFAAALGNNPRAIVLQPRAHNPTGTNQSAARRDAIVALLADRTTLVIEDDHSGDVAGAPLHSTGGARPDHTVLIHSFSKSHGPDLRIAAVGGARAPIEAMIRRRQLGPSWTSRLIQRVLLDLLADAEVDATVASASQEYARRRGALIGSLRDHGVPVDGGGSGLNLWVPVRREQDAVVALAAHSIGVAPGTPFEVEPGGDAHVRVTLSALETEAAIAEVGELLARAANVDGETAGAR